MRPDARRLSVLLLAIGCVGCGGASPSVSSVSPTGLPEGAALLFTSGETGDPVPGVGVSIAGQTYVADASGRIRTGGPVPLGSLLDTTGSGFFDRQTLLRDLSQTTFSLWPRSSPTGLDQEFVRNVVYGNNLVQEGALIRFSPRITLVPVIPSPEIVADAMALECHRIACERLSAATGGRIVFAVQSTPAEGPRVQSQVDPDDPTAQTGAGMRRSMTGFTITGGTLVFRTLRAARVLGVVMHELGHAYGLSHSVDYVRDVMGPGPDDRTDFSEPEKLAMRLMLQRGAGTRFPDNDRDAQVLTVIRQQEVTCTTVSNHY